MNIVESEVILNKAKIDFDIQTEFAYGDVTFYIMKIRAINICIQM